MARSQTIRLREAEGRPAPDARVIDAQFKEVGARRRGFWGKIKVAVVAMFWAAVIGFLIPPGWMLIQRIGEQFAP